MPANPTALLIAPVSGSTPPDVGIGVDPKPNICYNRLWVEIN